MQKKPIIPFFLVANLLLFLVFFVPLYVFDPGESIETIVIIVNFIQETATRLLPAVAAVCLLILFSLNGLKYALISLIYISLSGIVYTIPYYYLVGISGGLDSIESITFSFLVSVIYGLIFYLYALVLFLAAKAVFEKNLVREMIEKLPAISQKNISREEKLKMSKKAISIFPEKLDEGRAFDLSVPITVSVFTIPLIQFAIYLALEIHNATVYLVDFAGDYRGQEIITMVLSFLFILAMLFLTQFVCHTAKKKLINCKKEIE